MRLASSGFGRRAANGFTVAIGPRKIGVAPRQITQFLVICTFPCAAKAFACWRTVRVAKPTGLVRESYCLNPRFGLENCMHIPKSLLLATVAYLAISASKTLAKDSDDAAKLREAMRQKLAEEKSAQTAPAQVTPAAPAKPAAPAATAKPVTPATPAAPVKPTPAPVKPATQASATDSVVVGDNPEDAALREAMRARMADKAAPTAVPAAAPAEPAPAPTKPAEPAPSKAKPAKPAPSKAKPAKAASTPMQTPASPLAGSKEERLKHLLDQYKADQITPEEYHKQRAKIVAE